MPDVVMPWGAQDISLTLPEDWRLVDVARPQMRSAGTDWRERMGVTLAQPGTGPSLARLLAARRKGKICLIVEDVTRHSPVEAILDVLRKEFRVAGVADEQLEAVFATGMHPPMTAEQAREKLGHHADDLRWRSNPWTQPDRYVRVGSAEGVDVEIDRGVVEADLRVLISAVVPHLQAGFGGGYKMLLPGCASLQSIRAAHRKGIGRTFRQLVGLDGQTNPMRRVVDRAGQLVDAHHGTTFSVQFMLDQDNQPSTVAAGEPLPTQRQLAKQSSVACGAVLGGQADVLLVNAYPRDHDLWQSFKCIVNTLWAVRPGGVLVCYSDCPGGMGGIDPPGWPVSPAWTRRIIRWLGANPLANLITRLVPKLSGDAEFFVRLAMQTVERNTIILASETLYEQTGGKFPGVELLPSLAEAIDEADDLLGDGPQRVIAFPSGGISYPVPRRTPAERIAEG